MKKIIFRTIAFFLLAIIIIIGYVSLIGIETSRFNNQISEQLKSVDKDLDLELKKVKILLNPIKLIINIKTVGAKVSYKKKPIDLESIKTNLSIKSVINNNFALNNLNISTKSIEINNFLSFIKSFKNKPQIYVLDKIVNKGFIIADIDLDFDENGEIKNNYNIRGFIKDTNLSFLKNYQIKDLNFVFDITSNLYLIENIDLKLNQIPISSNKISFENKGNNFLVEGELNNQETNLNKKVINLIQNLYFKHFEIKKIKLESKNNFSFILDHKFNVKKFKLESKMELKNLTLMNNLNLQKFLPDINEEIEITDHLLDIYLVDENLSIKGKGNLLLQKNKDEVDYLIKSKNGKIEFNSTLSVLDNPFKIDILNYKKNEEKKLEIKVSGLNNKGNNTFNIIELKQNKNYFSLINLILTNDFKIEKFDKIKLDYLDKENTKNNLTIINKKNNYHISGKIFNSNSLIDRFINENEKKRSIFNKNTKFIINIDSVLLDQNNLVKNLKGKFSLKKNEIVDADLNAYFSDKEKFSFSIRSGANGKVTTFFIDRAEPIVKRYKFIKGYEKGKLDFYSVKKADSSISTLKIYDFNLKELPALTKLLTLASLQGIADILSGEGIGFDEFEMNFTNKGKLMTINEIYAIGPAISIMMEGYVEKSKLISLRGTLVPATTINKAIGSIPMLGKILVGTKTGEGVFGVSFKIKGPPKKLETTVNPIKTLTPRFITRTLEKIKKTN